MSFQQFPCALSNRPIFLLGVRLQQKLFGRSRALIGRRFSGYCALIGIINRFRRSAVGLSFFNLSHPSSLARRSLGLSLSRSLFHLLALCSSRCVSVSASCSLYVTCQMPRLFVHKLSYHFRSMNISYRNTRTHIAAAALSTCSLFLFLPSLVHPLSLSAPPLSPSITPLVLSSRLCVSVFQQSLGLPFFTPVASHLSMFLHTYPTYDHVSVVKKRNKIIISFRRVGCFMCSAVSLLILLYVF